MSCLKCQKQFEHHTKLELIDCIEWIQEQHHIRSEQTRTLHKELEKLTKHEDDK